MRFEFLGLVSCPEWFIAEISVLTKITAVKMKLIFSQLIEFYLQDPTPDHSPTPEITAKIGKLLAGTGLDVYESNAVVATLNFILHNSVQFHVSDSVLNKELIDLGLPKQNVESISKSYKAARDKLLEKSLDKMPRKNGTVDIEYSIHDYLGSSGSQLGATRFAELSLELSGGKNSNFIVGLEEVDEMIFELEKALAVVDKMEIK